MSTDRLKWLQALGTLTAGSMPVAEAQAKLGAYIPMLAQRFPDQAFTARSLEDVASKCKFFPSYAEICEHLGAWWKENRPVSQRFPQLAAPSPEPKKPPTPEEIAYVEARVAEIKAAVKETKNRPGAVKPYYLTPEQLRAQYIRDGREHMMPPYLREAT